MKSFVRFMLVVAVCLFASCGKNPTEVMRGQNSGGVRFTEIVDFGNGVYYFPYVRADFGRNLSRFIAEHPELRYVDAAPDGTGSRDGTYDSMSGYEHGRTVGYFVVFEPREKARE